MKIGLAGILAAAQITTTTTAINNINVTESSAATDTQIEVQEALPATLEPSLQELIKQTSLDYGVDPRSALAVAKCESHLKQYNNAGEVLRGKVNRYDVGIFQINEKNHLEKSREMGFEI